MSEDKKKPGMTLPCVCCVWEEIRRSVCEILRQIAEQRQNRLRSDEYDYATWSTRSWRAFAVQKLAVATQRSAAMEIARAMGLTTAYDTRGGLGGGPECAVM